MDKLDDVLDGIKITPEMTEAGEEVLYDYKWATTYSSRWLSELEICG